MINPPKTKDDELSVALERLKYERYRIDVAIRCLDILLERFPAYCKQHSRTVEDV